MKSEWSIMQGARWMVLPAKRSLLTKDARAVLRWKWQAHNSTYSSAMMNISLPLLEARKSSCHERRPFSYLINSYFSLMFEGLYIGHAT